MLITSLNNFIAKREAARAPSHTAAPEAAAPSDSPRAQAPRGPRGERRDGAPRLRRYFGSIRQLKNGTFQARYTGPDKEVHNGPKPFLTKRDASTWLDSVNTAITTGKWVAPLDLAGHYNRASDAPLFGQYAAQWIRERKNSEGQPLAATTVTGYHSLLRNHMKQFHELPVDKLTRQMVRTWNDEIVKSGKVTTASKAYQLLHGIYETLVDDGFVNVTPVRIKGAANASSGVEVIPPTDDELVRVVNAIDPRFRLLVLISASGALRSGEVRELRPKDIEIIQHPANGDRALLHIKRAVSYTAETGFTIKPPKSKAGVRSVERPPNLTAPVIEHLVENVLEHPDALLFHAVNDRTKHLAHATHWRHWNAARRTIGRPDLKLHALRHWGATTYSQIGATLRETQARLGHSTVSAAMRYQFSGNRDAELAQRLGRLSEPWSPDTE